MIISKKFHFSAAHRLLNHKGLCRNLHGHRYEIEISIKSDIEDEAGCLADFNDLKESIGGWIDRNLDHSTIVAADDSLLRSFLVISDSRYYLMNNSTTVEHLITNLAKSLKHNFDTKSSKIVRIIIWESPQNKVTLDLE